MTSDRMKQVETRQAETTQRAPLPEKKYFKIGEVADLVGVEPHVLRYWETQFSQIRPHKARSGHRLYRRREVETLLAIRDLLHVQRFTIAGARQALRSPGATTTPPTTLPPTTAEAEAIVGAMDTLDGEAEPDLVAPSASTGPPIALELPLGGPPAVLVDVHGLDGDDLSDAMSRELASRGGRRSVAELSYEVQGVSSYAVTRRPVSAARALPNGDGHHRRPKRDALAGAVADIQAILSWLDVEDQRDVRR